MVRIEKTVFISYRRKDISWALAVYQDLTHHGYDVFFDYTSIQGGDFEQIIVSNIKARAHFVLILTPTALDRCDKPDDWLRREIETAIDEKRNIIPLFFEGFIFGDDNVSEKLTGNLKNVSRYNGMNVHQDYFREAMERLRTKFLNVPLNAILHPVSTRVQEVVVEEQRAANKAAKEAKREALRKRQKEVVGKIMSLISSNSRQLKIVGFALIIFILFLAGGNYLVNNKLPITETSTLAITPTLAPEKDGMNMIYVSAGEFVMGSYDADDEKPVHTVNVDSFWIDQTEVSNNMYEKCVSEGKCNPPNDSYYFGNSNYANYPVVQVSWSDAVTYCSWANRRLPTETEWEKAARGPSGNPYPWGSELPTKGLLNYNKNIGAAVEIRTYPDGESFYGAYDMAGNVWEWVSTLYKAYPYDPDDGRENMDISAGTRVFRGGSWKDADIYVRSANRGLDFPTVTNLAVGFRCARSP